MNISPQLTVIGIFLVIIAAVILILILKLKRIAERKIERSLADRTANLQQWTLSWYFYATYIILGAAVLGAVGGFIFGGLLGRLAGHSPVGSALLGAAVGVPINILRELRRMLRRPRSGADILDSNPAPCSRKKPIVIPPEHRRDVVALTERAATHAESAIKELKHSPDSALRIVRAHSDARTLKLQFDFPEISSDDWAAETRGFLLLFEKGLTQDVDGTIIDFANGSFTFRRESLTT